MPYNIRGIWTLSQTTGHTVELNVTGPQPDGQIAVTAKVLQDGNLGSGFGWVNTEQFSVTIGWNGGSRGVYIGEFDRQGVLRGATFDAANPDVHAGWTSDRAFARQ